MTNPAYFDAFPTIALQRDDEGVLTVRLHSEQGPVSYAPQHHADWVRAFYEIGADPDNRVVILTGTGDEFIDRFDSEAWAKESPVSPARWETVHREGKRLLRNLLDIEVPVIAAINGPASVHAELAVLSDITLAASTATLSDAPHFPNATVPGDGVQIVWPELLGSNRGRYFLLTGQVLSAAEAHGLGVVNEVLEPAHLLERAYELAALILAKPPLVTRYTRTVTSLRWKRLLDPDLGYGLALEGLGAIETVLSYQHASAAGR